MYTILITNDNEMDVSVIEPVVEGSNKANKIRFLVPQMYEDLDMSEFTVTLEYVIPKSRWSYNYVLEPSEELYKGMLEYLYEITDEFTEEDGEVEVHLTFVKDDIVREIRPTTIRVYPITLGTIKKRGEVE